MTVSSTSARRRRLNALIRSSGFLAVCIMVTNVATYGFQIIAARILGPGQYGGVASMMSLLLVVGVIQLGMQATASRRVTEAPGHERAIEQTVLRATYRAAIVLGAVMLVASPLVWRLLRLDSIYPALLVAVCAVPLTIMGGQAGVLQGERRWLGLALVYLALGVPRVVVATAAMWIRPTEGAAMAGVALAQFAPAVVGWWVLRRRTSAAKAGPIRPVVVEMLHGSFALLGFFALSNVDILIARNVLSDHASGLYAGGLILTKAVLFLPQFVVIIAFPSMSAEASRRSALLKSLALVGGLGICAIAGSWLLSWLAMVFIGGPDYAEIEGLLWVFAILGTVLSVLQLLVYSVLARRSRLSAYLLWIAVAAAIALGAVQSTVDGLVWTVLTIDAILVAVLLSVTFWRLNRPQPTAH
ncbi:O-antigen/teichoic acid export membrane protein [Nocardioides albertanoniae]|uniref:O-antigen/teichoic acid export membrane protein n=1 Tax=Nocardioides albertanoniae TaxID=1175486 RepID=A0A543A9I8_9ACTN|nr:polysaccharide biosynthesis protein [Nocardioides albertanoniae]TQL69170.1 O-antigen/teichoic acid export membrane protein [Nocardioides albertanoniae]